MDCADVNSVNNSAMDTSSVETQMGSRTGGGDTDCGSDSNDEYDQEQLNALGKG